MIEMLILIAAAVSNWFICKILLGLQNIFTVLCSFVCLHGTSPRSKYREIPFIAFCVSTVIFQ